MVEILWIIVILAASAVFWRFAWPSVKADIREREAMTEEELKDDGWPHR